MTGGGSLRDEVEEIAAAVIRLQPVQRQRLFDLLIAQGYLPAEGATTAPTFEQLDLTLLDSSHNRPPDYVLVFDGGSKGNPGWGYGSYAIIRVQDGAQRLERLELGDGYTNNEAEYDSLIAALEDLLQRIDEAGRQPEKFALEVRGDSALVINQVQGKWKAHEPRMRGRRDVCRRLLARFGAVVLKLQPREESVRVLGH